MLKLLRPRAGVGAFAAVVATAWLVSPDAAAVPVLRFTTPLPGVVAVMPGRVVAPGIGAVVPGVAIVLGAGVAGVAGVVVCAWATPKTSTAAARPVVNDFM